MMQVGIEKESQSKYDDDDDTLRVYSKALHPIAITHKDKQVKYCWDLFM